MCVCVRDRAREKVSGKPGRLLNLSKYSMIMSTHVPDHLTVDCQVRSYVYRHTFNLHSSKSLLRLNIDGIKKTTTVKIKTWERGLLWRVWYSKQQDFSLHQYMLKHRNICFVLPMLELEQLLGRSPPHD